MSAAPLIIDMHTHFFPETWPDLAEKFGTPDWPWMKHHGDGTATVMVGDKEFRPIYSACWDVDKRLEEMDQYGIEFGIQSLNSPGIQSVLEPAQAVELAQRANDILAGEVARVILDALE